MDRPKNFVLHDSFRSLYRRKTRPSRLEVVQLTRYLAHVFVGEVGLSGPGEGRIFRSAGEDPLPAATASDLSRKRERLQIPRKFIGSKLNDLQAGG